ncbi:dipeptide ABC transporter ATP-binding protein [Nocardioides panacihumi]|uniref:Dipeptide ABC transporter ATP-binding protein n=1 Tax=Nocardioides panacihumi TaxID=400774 RepID=A0ABN2RUD9_9ACTN
MAKKSTTRHLRDAAEPILSVRDLVVHYPARTGHVGSGAEVVHAVCGVTFELHQQETLAIVGESGCGKTTTARALLNLRQPTSGQVLYDGDDLATLSPKAMRRHRQRLQIVFQDPLASLDPRMTVREAVAEPLRIHRMTGAGYRERVDRLLSSVGIDPRDADRHPHQFSGGQRQRVAIARALALEPQVVVLDEPVSALDVSVQAGVLNLLDELQAETGVSYIFVSHDLSVVRHIADRVAVMYLGKIVEIASCDELFEHPSHPYTEALISAIPIPDPHRERARERILLAGDVPSPIDPPEGCRFRTRCPRFANQLTEAEQAVCATRPPELVELDASHASACHFPSAVRAGALL